MLPEICCAAALKPRNIASIAQVRFLQVVIVIYVSFSLLRIILAVVGGRGDITCIADTQMGEYANRFVRLDFFPDPRPQND